jgi:hypothetical protein
MVPETSVIFNQLTRLLARDDFIVLSLTAVHRARHNLNIPCASFIAYWFPNCGPQITWVQCFILHVFDDIFKVSNCGIRNCEISGSVT